MLDLPHALLLSFEAEPVLVLVLDWAGGGGHDNVIVPSRLQPGAGPKYVVRAQSTSVVQQTASMRSW